MNQRQNGQMIRSEADKKYSADQGSTVANPFINDTIVNAIVIMICTPICSRSSHSPRRNMITSWDISCFDTALLPRTIVYIVGCVKLDVFGEPWIVAPPNCLLQAGHAVEVGVDSG